MKHTGTKLVLGLACLALAAGVASWSYRYGATHLATRFWGTEAAFLIAQPSQVGLFRLELAGSEAVSSEGSDMSLDLGRPYLAKHTRELTNERGMIHFRHALMSDGNYAWDSQLELHEIDWRWCMRFHNEQNQALVVLAEDLTTIGLVDAEGTRQVQAISCHPMAGALRVYFEQLGLSVASTLE